MVKFFINRPIFATVLALILVVAGLVTLHILPIAQYPEITPPTQIVHEKRLVLHLLVVSIRNRSSGRLVQHR